MARIIVDEKVCKGCGMCVHACPLKIIALDKTRLTLRATTPPSWWSLKSAWAALPCATMCPDTAITVER